MADDDRYGWLDKEAAERLLRGAAVNARSTRRSGRHIAGQGSRDGRAAQETDPAGSAPGPRTGEHPAEDRLGVLFDALVAEQTATPHALGAARTGTAPGPTGAELPGEAAALEAFRAAHPEFDSEHRGTVDNSAGTTESETVVGRRAAARESRRRSRDRRPGADGPSSLLRRPLRAGFAMAVAGCALGGVAAVAAGTGVLPTPFGGNDSPATTVSPWGTPEDDREVAAGGGRGRGPDDGSGASRGVGEGDSSGSRSGEGLAGTEGGVDGKKPKKPGGNEDWWHGNGKGLSDSDKKAMARALCDAYENGELSARDRIRLETVAGSAEAVKDFCDKNDKGRDEHTDSGRSDGTGGVGTSGDSDSDSGSGGSSSGDESGGASGYSGAQSEGGSGGGKSGDGQPQGSDGESATTSTPTSPSPSPDASNPSPSPDDDGAAAGS